MTGPASGTRRAMLLRLPGTSRRGQDMANDGGRRRFRSRFSRAAMRAWIRDNKFFALALTGGLLLRIDTELGYQWQVWFNDSFTYVSDVINLHPDTTRPAGYPIFLKILEPLHSYAVVTILQHLMGLAIAVMIYALARYRFGAPRWIATLATLPVLFDGFQIQLEHLILSDVPFEFLIVLATTLLLWDRKPSWQRCTLIGLILGVADTVRSVALPLLPIFAIYILLRRIGWRAAVGALVACLTPILLYCTWFYSVYGQFAMTESTGSILYSRVMAFADCSKIHNLPADELSLCITTPPERAADIAGLPVDPAVPAGPVPAVQVLRAAEPAGRGLRQAGHPGPAAGLRPDRGLRHDPGVRVEAVRVPERGRPITSTCSATSHCPSRAGPTGRSGRSAHPWPTTSAATR